MKIAPIVHELVRRGHDVWALARSDVSAAKLGESGATPVAGDISSPQSWAGRLPLVDATALSSLEDLAAECRRRECRLIIAGLQQQPRQAMHRMGLLRRHRVLLTSNGFMALEKAKAMLGRPY